MTHLGWLDQYIGTHSKRERARGERALLRVEEIGKTLRDETDQRLQKRARALRARAVGGASLDDLMVETFSLVREVSFRQIGLRHFDVQILGGVALHRGNIVEMKTGEGKTLVATLPVILHALSGRGTHIVTVNDYLAERDARWMGPVFRFMGLSVGVLSEDMDHADEHEARKAAYEADVTYVNNHELVFDYLRDNLALSRHEQVQRPLHFALVDEVDLLLLDEAGTPLIISGAAHDGVDLSTMARQIVSPLREADDFHVDHKTRRVSINDDGWTRMERKLQVDNLAAPEHVDWQHALHNALLAHAVYQRDVDYIVQDGEILLIDDYTGRVSPDKRFSDGLHQALEAKEGVIVQAEDRTLAKVSYQMFFRIYPALCGMTGTVYSARDEIQRTYGLRVVVVPTNKPVIRVDAPSKVFKSSGEKLEAVVEEICEMVSHGRPVLVGTTSVRESELVGRLLTERGIEHTVLNAKDDRDEATVIAQAGRQSAVTVSTNMAGRGVDILLGGNPEELDVRGSGTIEKQCEDDREQVMNAGGLMVIGTGLHESGRIDDQLRGRAGRQGDPGGSQFFLSLDDSIYRKFGERDRGFQVLQELRRKLRDHPSGEPVRDKSILRTLRTLQKKVEVENESIRRDVLRYDVVVDHQRRTIYGWRQTLLAQRPDETIGLLREMASDMVGEWGGHVFSGDSDVGEDTKREIESTFQAMFGDQFEALSELSEDTVEHTLALVENWLNHTESVIGAEQLASLAGQVMLCEIDEMWTEHLGNLEQLDDATGLREYGQLDPLLEFKREAHHLYQAMLREIRAQTLANLFSILPMTHRSVLP
ncbi:MAG: preprotein translocase subunit SecA [Deltaproteobacteria bacterium]|nr:preprotein translocase subunit SecA [Deltaproteobacteria bacterium]